MRTKMNRSAVSPDRATQTKNDHLHYSKSTIVRSMPVRRVGGRIVGGLTSDVAYSYAFPRHLKLEHQLREPAGSWDAATLAAAERAAARWAETECDYRIYRALLSDFRRYGFPDWRGYGEQAGLDLAHWSLRRVGEPPAAVQLRTLGGAQ